MKNLSALVALIVGIVCFFVNSELAITLIAIYLVIVGLLGLITADSPLKERRTEPLRTPKAETDEEK